MFILVKDIVKIMSEMAPARLAAGITWDCRLAGMKKKCG